MANSYGGQALIEGVMMRGKHTQAMCARLEDGRIVSEVEEFTLLSQRNKFFALPLVRGVCSMIDSLVQRGCRPNRLVHQCFPRRG